jgi:4,5-dihydroxyphthalate decarboxylase
VSISARSASCADIRQQRPEARTLGEEALRHERHQHGVDLAAREPWLAQALSDLLDESQRLWLEKRRRYADTTPWLIDELVRSGHDLPENWNESGLAANRAMIAAFIEQLRIQNLAETDLTPETLFPAVPALEGAK